MAFWLSKSESLISGRGKKVWIMHTRQGKEHRGSRGDLQVFAECSSKEPGSASKLPGSGGQTLYFNFVQRTDSERHHMSAVVCVVFSRV